MPSGSFPRLYHQKHQTSRPLQQGRDEAVGSLGPKPALCLLLEWSSRQTEGYCVRQLTQLVNSNSHFLKHIRAYKFILLFFSSSFYWSRVDLQCQVSFRCTAQRFSYICSHIYVHTHIYVYILFQILIPYMLLQNIEYSSLCYTVGPC